LYPKSAKRWLVEFVGTGKVSSNEQQKRLSEKDNAHFKALLGKGKSATGSAPFLFWRAISKARLYKSGQIFQRVHTAQRLKPLIEPEQPSMLVFRCSKLVG
jgi:hypothetical protein